ncbi:MAG: shikimate kinase [Balneolaceae bacterium]|nr:shikimate kinase [Balneolaceae bacterium]
MNEYRLKKYQQSFFMVGFMASGKSTIGRLLAKKIERPFLDLDAYIVEKEGRDIKQIFDENGESYFRNLEWKALLEVTQNFKGVVSLGGGALHNQQVVDHLKIYGLMIFLKTDISVTVDRVLRNKKRPIVLDTEGELKSRETLFNELESLYLKRIDLYKQAQIIIESTGNETKDHQVARVIEKLLRYV